MTKAILYFNALLLIACATTRSPIQSISDARSAIAAAEQHCVAISCQDDALRQAQTDITHAEYLLHHGEKKAASQAAQQALNHAQNILRKLNHDQTATN